jgi:tricorn protease
VKVAAASSSSPGNDDKSASLDGVTMHVTPREEWGQILEEAYRLNRDFFYMKNMTSINWREITDRYKTLLPRLSGREDLNDVLGT